MKRIVFLLIAVMAGLMAMANDIDNGYRIDSWKYEATVAANNSWQVKETMVVSFLEERHGIYRYIPRAFAQHHAVNGTEALYNYHTSIDDVKVDGYEFVTMGNDDSQDNLIIRIGKEDVTLMGEHKYVISYTIQYPDDRYTVSDMLSHTVLGPDCSTTIGDFSFDIRFAKPLPQAMVLHTYSGSWGSKGNDLGIAVKVEGNQISGHASDIEPYNGITISAELPEGYWVGAPARSATTAYVWFAIAALLFIFTMSRLLLHRRKRPLMVLEYNAPEGISSAEVGVIIDNTSDFSDLTSLVVWWASKGYLKIREIEGKKKLFGKGSPDIELIITTPLPDDAPDYQKKFWKALFKYNKTDSVILSKLGDRHEELQGALLALSRHFKGKRKLTTANVMTMLSAFLFLVAGIGFFSTSSSVDDFNDELFLYSALGWAMFVFFAGIIRMATSNYDMIKRFYWRLVQYIIMILIALADVAMLCFDIYNEPDMLVPLNLMVAVVVGGWLIALLSARMQKDTKYRLEQMSLLLGFREFIKTSEMPMLKAMVDENPSYFYDVLPYAMVFGLSKKWQKQFQGIDMPAPTWYEASAANSNMSGLMMADHISHSVAGSISKALTVSSHDTTSASSSSGGGGVSFVGGGGGGGGVGSW